MHLPQAIEHWPLDGGWDEERLTAELHALGGDGFDLDLLGFTDAELDRSMAPLDDNDGEAGEVAAGSSVADAAISS